MFTLTRRLFLKLGLLLAGTRSFGKAAVAEKPGDLIVDIIKYRLAYIRCPEEDMEKFATALLDESPLSFVPGDDLEKMSNLLKNPGLSAQLPRHIVVNLLRIERKVIANFLVSTDFFNKPHAIRTPVTFIAYRTPQTLGCDNPFARFD